MDKLAGEVVALLRQKKLTLGVVESATGGLVSHLITGVPGASEVFTGGITAYSNAVKVAVAGVRPTTLKRYGAVSAAVARQMAAGGRKVLGVDICIADTGIAGPSGATPAKPVGLFYLGLAHRGGVLTRRHHFTGTREENKMSAALTALDWVREQIYSMC